MTTYLVILAVVSVMGATLYFSIRRDGKNAEKLKRTEGSLKNVKKANKARKRLRDDESYRKRLRDKFTRK